MFIVDNIANNEIEFSYLIDSFTLQHARLGHIGASTIKQMVKFDMIHTMRIILTNLKHVQNLK